MLIYHLIVIVHCTQNLKKCHFCCSCSPNNSSSHAANLSGLGFDATHLNTLFNNICVDASDEDLENLHFSNIDEQYVDVSSIKSLAFNNTSTSISVMCVNMRSLANLQNFSKPEALICSMELKPDIISITETWTRPYASGPYNSLCGYVFVWLQFCIKL